jgi:type IV pilus assembly protein PilQ
MAALVSLGDLRALLGALRYRMAFRSGAFARSSRWTSRAFVGLTVLVLTATFVVGAHAQTSALEVTDVRLVTPKVGAAEISVQTNGKPTYTARVADGGKRLLVDIAGASVTGAPTAITEGNDVVAGIMTQTFGKPVATRLNVTLKKNAGYRISSHDHGLVVELVAGDKTTPLPAGAAPRVAPKATPAETTASIRDVRFDHEEGRDRIVIELAGDVKWETTQSKRAARLEISSAKLPASLQRKLDTGAFGGSVKSVSTFVSPTNPDHVIIEVERDVEAKSMVARQGNDLVYTFATGAIPSMHSGIASDGGAARKVRTVAREREDYSQLPKASTKMDAEILEQKTEADAADAFLPTMNGQVIGDEDYNRQVKVAAGRRIDLDLKDADIHDVLRLFSDVGKVNIVTADNVSGTVTIRMRSVPWDQAMEVVLQAKGLGMVRKGNLIRVAPMADLNKERDLALARRKAEFELAPLETRLIPVSYAQAGEMQARAKDLLSPRGTIAVDARTNVLIARDIAGNLNQVEELVRSLDTQTPQVLIESRIVEATSRFLREVGIQWGGDATFNQARGNDTGVAFPNSVGLAGGASDGQTPTAGLSPTQQRVANPNFAVNLPAAVGTGTGGALGLTFGSVDGNFNLNVRLSAAESSGMVRIISSPRVLTLDNRQARISQGTLIPFSQVSAQGVQTTFQEARLQLLVQPHVTADGSVSMTVKINRDEPDFNQTSARGDPTILKRDAETELLVQDGHTAVIGGIYTRNTGRNIDQVPLLGDIPILGVLFQKRRSSDIRSELVIFITPRIVNRAESLGR